MKISAFLIGAGLLGAQLVSMAGPAQAGGDGGGGSGSYPPSCPVSYSKLKTALQAADKANVNCVAASAGQKCGGFKNHFWAVVVNRQGVVCAVAFSGTYQELAVACQPADRRSEGIHGQRPEPQSRQSDRYGCSLHSAALPVRPTEQRKRRQPAVCP